MIVENVLQEAGALATLAGIMAGFAFSAVVELISGGKEGKLTTVTIVLFSMTALMMLFSLIAFILIFAAAAELNEVAPEMDALGTYALVVLLGGVYVFFAGVGLAGWIRSKATGIATAILALITACLTTVVLGSVLSIFS
jgi:hypothetical protein